MLGFDISPMSARIVHEDIDHLNLNAYDKAIRALIAHPDNEIGVLNRTDFPTNGDKEDNLNIPVPMPHGSG